MRECIENYCYSFFGCSSYNVSAWQGLNWFASEFKERGIGVLPGGNGRISTRLKEKIQSLDPDCLKTAMPVVDLQHDPKTGMNLVTVALSRDTRNCSYRTYRSKYVVLTCPLFVSKRILSSEFPESVRRGIERFNYTAYIVTNTFIDGTVLKDYWDIYCLNDYPLLGKSGQSFYRGKPFMDIINASWALGKRRLRDAQKADMKKTVITAYSSHPFSGQREDLLRDEYCEDAKERVRRELVRLLAPYGLKESVLPDGDMRCFRQIREFCPAGFSMQYACRSKRKGYTSPGLSF